MPAIPTVLHRLNEVVFNLSETVNFPSSLDDFERPFGDASLQDVILTMFHSRDMAIDRRMTRFVASLRATGSQALVVVFCLQQSQAEVTRQLQRYRNVHVIGYQDRPVYDGAIFWSSTFRFTFAMLFLQRFRNVFQHAMTSDLFDVIFQEDPFAWLRGRLAENRAGGEASRDRTLIVAEEVAVMGVKDQPDNGINLEWARWCNGREEHLNNRFALCSGTTLGPLAAMLKYIEAMDHLGRVEGICGALAQDQGAHNAILYGSPDFLKMLDPQSADSGVIVTFNGVRTARFDDKGKMLNMKGTRYIILHQVNRCSWVQNYDRLKSAEGVHPPLFEAAKEGLSCTDIEWPRWLPESAYSLVTAVPSK